MKKVENTPRKAFRHHRARVFQVLVFFIVFYICAVISWLIPLRPSYSAAENRELTRFPSFSFSALASGEWFDDIGTWFSDTFPCRDALLSLNGAVKSLYGVSSVQISSNVQEGDEIPDAPAEPATMPETTAPATEPATQPVTSAAGQTDDDRQRPPGLDHEPAQDLGATLLIGDSAFEYYNFVQSKADEYAATVNRACSQLAGSAAVYDIIVPTSMDICVPDSVRKGLKTSDQKKAIEYMYGSMSGQVKTVPLFDTLRSHHENGEYIYFRTDHHWTALGAYYAYTGFCETKGTPAAALSTFEEHVYSDYLGSFYRETGKPKALGNHPDIVVAYEPPHGNTMTITDSKGKSFESPIVSDVTTWNRYYKYSTFIGGDNPLSVIRNDAAATRDTCVLVKESFGNAFAPFLSETYRTVYIIDYRYFHKVDSRSLQQFVREEGVDDVIFLNNISVTRSADLLERLSYLVR